jgi:hypothetical protein
MKRRLTVIAVMVTVGALVVLSLAWKPLRSQLSLSLTQHPQPFTELYFTHFAALPTFVFTGRVYPVEYTVVGHHERSPEVTVTATVSYSGGSAQTLGRETLRFGQGGRATGTFTFSPPVRHQIYYVMISLPLGQSIQWRVVAP